MSEGREYTVDLTRVRSERTLHGRIAAALPVPEGYGRNYDALHDFLTEWGEGMSVRFLNCAGSFATLRAVCEDARRETPGLAIAFERAVRRRA